MDEMNKPIISALVGYGILMLMISLYWMRKVKKPADFLMARRSLSGLVVMGTVLATGIGTGVTLGASGLSYKHGWAGCVYPIGLGLGFVIAGLCFSRMRRYEFMTLSEEVACYYGGNRVVYHFSSIGLFLSKLCWLTVQIIGGGHVLNLITGLPLTSCIVSAGVLMAVTAIPGGLLTVVYTDVIQALILLLGFIFLAVISLDRVGGLEGLRESVPAEYFSFLGIDSMGAMGVFGLMLAMILNHIADSNTRHRIYSSRSEKAAKFGLCSAGVLEIAFSVVVGITGMYVFAIHPDLSLSEQAIPWLAMNQLPAWAAIVVVVAIAAAIFSSGDSDAAVSGTFFIRHIFPLFTGRHSRNPLRTTRWAMVVIFLASTTLALVVKQDIARFVAGFVAFILSGLAVAILLGRFWNRATWQGAVTAIILGAGVSLSVFYVQALKDFWVSPAIPASVAALVGAVVVSLRTSPKKKPFEEVALEMKEERKQLDR